MRYAKPPVGDADAPAVVALIEQHWHLIAVTAKRLFPRATPLDQEELEDIGLMALLRAARTFDAKKAGHHGRSARFQTYAIHLMRQDMKEAMQRRWMLSQRWFDGPCFGSVDASQIPGVPVSLSVPVGEGDESAMPLQDLVPDADTPNPEETLLRRWEREEWSALLWPAIERLSCDDRDILLRYYREEQTFADIARATGKAPQVVNQAHRRALSHLRARPDIRVLLWPATG
jgi:RNA polymerase sigma factor (sigma-70 family)